MTADALKKITTDALDTLAALLDEGHSDQLTALLKTMARFHKYFLAQRLSHREPAPDRDARRRLPDLAHDGSLRSQGREGHRDPGADRRPTRGRVRRRRTREPSSASARRTCSMDYLGIRIARTGRPAVEMRMWRPARASSGSSFSWCSRERARRGPRGEGAKRPIAGWRARSREQRRVG